MASENPLRDASNAIFTSLGYRVVSNSINSTRAGRIISVECDAPNFDSAKARNEWKRARVAELSAVGLVFYPEDRGTIKKGLFYIYGTLPNERVPGFVEHKTPKGPSHRELPPSVADYITGELGRDLKEIIAHRHVSGNEPKYAVLMGKKGYMWTVIFVGSYVARRPLGDYEEATQGNAMLVSWNCLSDGDEWEHSVEKFKNAPNNFF